MKDIIESLIEQKYSRLLDWRYSTQRNDYPIKIAKNLLYDALTLIEMWSDLNKTFRAFNLSGSKSFMIIFLKLTNTFLCEGDKFKQRIYCHS